MVVEALTDYNLFAWHAVFSYSGTLNDKVFGTAVFCCSPYVMVIFQS
jgi:hypothetical protein